MFRSSRLFFVVLIALIFATAAFAFAASITGLPSTRAGQGATVIGGYTISALDYTLSSPNPSTITAVTFTLDAAAANVSVSLDGTTFVVCTNVSGNDWSCPTTATVAAASNLVVIASDR